MEQGSIQHSGYLTPGDEINVQGGFTVHFQKKQRRYWTLQYFGEGNLVLSGYKDEKSFKRSSSTKTSTLGRQRKLSSAPIDTIRLMTSLKVHKFEMKTKKKVENALIIVSGSHPKFFRPDNKDELDAWHSIFKQFSSDDTTQPIKRRERVTRGRKTLTPHPASTASSRHESSNLERYSGSSTSSIRSLRESERSSSSSMSSEELNDYSPPQIFPSTLFFDTEDDDHNTSPIPSPMLRDHTEGRTSGNDRKSIFIRNSEGIYEERQSPRESTTSTESGFYDSVLHRNDDSRPDSVYDYLPPLSSSPSLRSVHTTSSEDEQPVLPVKMSRTSKQSSFDKTDSSIPEEDEDDQVGDMAGRLAENLGVKNSPELQQILNDDGTNHPYMNLKLRTSSPAHGETTSPRLPERSPRLPPRRKTSLSSHMSDTEYHQQVLHHVHGSRRRAESMPIGSPCISQPPIPEKIQPYSHVEKLMNEQARDQIEVHIKKEDLVDSIALVDIRGKVIIAGWSIGTIGNLHVGDHLVQVNDQVVSQAEWANTFIKTSSKSTIALHIHRLPYAKVLNCTRIHEDTLWGIECKANEITHVRSGPAKEAGLTEKSESSAFSKKSCEWVITEAANKPIKLTCPKDEMNRFLVTKDLELSLVVQPKDFISEVNKALNKFKRSSLYRVG